MAMTEFKAALTQVATERGISAEDVMESIRIALISAYKRDYGEESAEDMVVNIDEDTGEVQLMKEGKDVTPEGFGRIAAQTAKQVILQKIRETEKQNIYDEYEDKVGTLITGTIFRMEGNRVILDLGKAHGVMPQSEQVRSENYKMNQRLKVYVKEVSQGARGTEIIVSRSDPQFVIKLFEHEVPEISSGVVVIQKIAREPGSRTKMAVQSMDEKIDPVGSCVGQKGVRVQSIINELFGEKIDIIPYSSIPEKFVAASLSPARVSSVEIDEDEKKAIVSVPEDQQSLAIGKEGQNARLANKLTEWKIDIKGATGLFDSQSGEPIIGEQSDDNVVGVWDAAIRKVEKAEAEKAATNEDTTETDLQTDEPKKQQEVTSNEETPKVQENEEVLEESVENESENAPEQTDN